MTMTTTPVQISTVVDTPRDNTTVVTVVHKNNNNNGGCMDNDDDHDDHDESNSNSENITASKKLFSSSFNSHSWVTSSPTSSILAEADLGELPQQLHEDIMALPPPISTTATTVHTTTKLSTTLSTTGPSSSLQSTSSNNIHNHDASSNDNNNNNKNSSSNSAWNVLPASSKSQRTKNPIRAIVDPIVANMASTAADRPDGKEHISLALGDPTAAGHLPPCPAAVTAVLEALQHPEHNHNKAAAGYANACGTIEARKAIAAFHSTTTTTTTITNDDSVSPDHVIVASGCSGALELALTALLEPGDVLLVPRPGFPLYQVICEAHGASVLHYPLQPENGWQVDLDFIRNLLLPTTTQESSSSLSSSDGVFSNKNNKSKNGTIKALLINNPSNPTGAVYSKQHLQDIVALCREFHLPVVADEVYGDLVFSTATFHPLATVAAALGRHVPVLTVSGLGKQFLVPGWRIGWMVIHDNIHGTLSDVLAGAKRLAQIILGASHLAQTAIPALLVQQDSSSGSSNNNNSRASEIAQWKAQLRATLERQANFVCEALTEQVHSNLLTVYRPAGAMYAMIQLYPEHWDDSIHNDVDFCTLLLQEENVFVLPGTCFELADTARIVFCAPIPILQEAVNRIAAFSQRHARCTSVLPTPSHCVE